MKVARHFSISFCILLLLLAGTSCRQDFRSVSASLPGKEMGPLDKLMQGNKRFSHWQPQHPDESRQRVIEISKEQHPFAVVICCSDSRVSPELIFDQGLGDLFVIRTAGNLIGGLEMGSVEYAVEHLGVSLIVVMGHEQCGAVKAFVEKGEATGHIREIVDSISSEEEIRNLPLKDVNRLKHCIEANTLHGVHQLERGSAIIREKLDHKELEIRAANYDLEKGVVTLLSH